MSDANETTISVGDLTLVVEPCLTPRNDGSVAVYLHTKDGAGRYSHVVPSQFLAKIVTKEHPWPTDKAEKDPKRIALRDLNHPAAKGCIAFVKELMETEAKRNPATPPAE